MITGSAPLSKEVLEFLQIAFCTKIQEGYGQTEATAISFLCDEKDPLAGHVGGVVTGLEAKIVDVPEMNYFAKDKNPNNVYETTPRGEVCLRGPHVFAGYYKLPEKTAESIDERGWLHSGDIGQMMPNGTLRIIDRKKNIFKLQQGEYVAPEKIESIYQRCEYVCENFIYGDSLQHYLVGIIFPDEEQIRSLSKELGLKPDLTMYELCSNQQI